jgi:soluble lytic murein transglycosylase-like protein
LRDLVTFLCAFLTAAQVLAAPSPSTGNIAATAMDMAPTIGAASPEKPVSSLTPAERVRLAARHEHGEGVAQDFARAHELYCFAAKMGDAQAQYALGWMYANARGIQRNDAVAAQLFSMAASQGHPQARAMLEIAPLKGQPAMPACLAPDPVKPALAKNENLIPPVVFPRGRIADMVSRVSPQYEVDPHLILAFIRIESGFNENAVSPKNAQGLMQLIPDTARRFRVKDVFDPEQNIKGGTAYIQWLLAYFKGNVPLVAAAYNAGERAVERYRGIPPFPETRDYVRKITALYKNATHPYKSAVTAPSAVMLFEQSAQKVVAK